MKHEILHPQPYKGTNNRKMTKARIDAISKTQSIPIWEKDKNGIKVKFLGYRYIKHTAPKQR